MLNIGKKHNHLILIVFIVVICLFCQSSLAAKSKEPSKHYSSIEEFISEQKTIRLIADNCPGYGNQAATANTLTRLRQMGFKGTFEFVYANATTAKITTLFNLPSNIPDVYFDAKTGTQFIKIKVFIDKLRAKKLEKQTLGLNGANDEGFCGIAAADHIDTSDFTSVQCENGASFMNTTMFASLTPFYERFNYLDAFDQYVYKPDPQPNSNNKFFIMPVATFADAEAYVKNDAALMQKKPALLPFITGMKNHHFNVLPTYGIDIQDAEKCDDFPGNILEIITAARYAQLTGPASFRTRALIIPVFYDYQKEANLLMQFLVTDNWGKYETPGMENARKVLKDLALASVFSIADISDPKTTKIISDLKPGQILLLSLGSLPKTVFDGIYNHTDTNIWPQVREGANSFNTLALTGRPHFRCGGWEWDIGYDLVTDPALKVRLQDFYGKFCRGASTWRDHSDTYQSMADFMIEAQNLNSPFSLYFKHIKEEAAKPENDRIRFALEGILSMVNSK